MSLSGSPGDNFGADADAASRPDRGLTNPYAVILRKPGTARFSIAAAIARLPMAMVGLAIVLITEHSYSSYAAGGRVTAAYLVASAIAVPQIARLIDRFGQSRVMRPLVIANAVLIVALGAAIIGRLPEWTLWVLAIGVGATIGAFGALVRARWTYALDQPQDLHTAFSLESAVDEFIFVIGPTVATILVVQVWPLAGLLVPAAAAAIGGLWFCGQRSTEPPVTYGTRNKHESARSVLRSGGLIAMSTIFLFVGVVFGSVEVTTVAFAKESGREELAGVILAVFAVGSMVAGLLFGTRHFRMSLIRRLVISLAVLSAGMIAVLAASNLWQLTVVLLVTGFAIAPTMITGNSIIHQVVGSDQLTEGLAWASTAMVVGVSGGTAVAGVFIDDHGARAGYILAAGGGGAALCVAIAAAVMLRRRS